MFTLKLAAFAGHDIMIQWMPGFGDPVNYRLNS